MPMRRSNQLSYEATDGESWSFVGLYLSVMNESLNKMIHKMNAILKIWIHKWLGPTICGFSAQLVGASQRHHEVTVSNPVTLLMVLGLSTQVPKFAKIAFIIVRIITSPEAVCCCFVFPSSWNCPKQDGDTLPRNMAISCAQPYNLQGVNHRQPLSSSKAVPLWWDLTRSKQLLAVTSAWWYGCAHA